VKALVLNRPHDAEIRRVPDPEPMAGALLRVERVGVCGTDASIFRGNIAVSYPRVMGHEMVGTVEEPGPLGLFRQGTRVMVDPSVTCGYCPPCRADRPNLCIRGGLLGRDLEGVFSEFLAVSETQIHQVPDSIDPGAGPLLQVLGTCVHAQEGAAVFPGQVAAVVGLGVTGLLHLQLLAARGVDRIVAVTRSEWKKNLAMRLGATTVVTFDDAARTVREMSSGLGADLVIECAGHEATLSQSIDLAGPGATVIAFGTLTGGGTGLPYYELYHKELTLRNPRAALPRDYARAVDLAATGLIELTPLVTHRLSLEEAPKALGALIDDPSTLKIVFEVS
jgi:L-iditol 2-dehydrogenase